MKDQTKRILTWGGFVVGVVLLLVVLANVGGSPNTSVSGSANLTQAVDTSTEHIKGNPNASVVLVEYSDFQCPACAGYAPILKQLLEESGDDVALVYRHFPLRSIHPQAQLAAQAAYAASMQDAFWEYHDSLFNTQQTWSGSRSAEDHFIALAESLNLNVEQFTQDMNSSQARQAVNDDYNSGVQSQVNGTPTIFINGEPMQLPRSYADLQTIVAAAAQQ